jgi:hypothetical protein
LYEVQVQQLDQFTVSNNNTILPSKQQRRKTYKPTQQKQQPTNTSSSTTNKRMKSLPNTDTEKINNLTKEIDALEFVMELWNELYDQDGNIYTEYGSNEFKRKTWFQLLEQHHEEYILRCM